MSKIRHGCRRTRLYRIWCAMKSRCSNPNNDGYRYYGDRGISVCEEWANDFIPFMDWAISHGYAPNLTIDRIDKNGDYEPSNCRWATVAEQNRNKRKSKPIVTDRYKALAAIEGITLEEAKAY